MSMSFSQQVPSVMRSIYQEEYGPPEDVLKLKTVPVPRIKPGFVLVQVKALSTHAGDWHLIRGTPWFIRLLFGGIMKPKINIPGCDMCGIIRDIHKQDVDREFNIGDEVFGDLSINNNFQTFAEYVIAPIDFIVKKPKNISYQQAAVSGVSALAAIQVTKDSLNYIKNNYNNNNKIKILINGCSGGVGTFLIQFIKYLYATNNIHVEVSGICHKKKADVIKKLGADHIIDYTIQNVFDLNVSYDIIIDTACFQSPFNYTEILNKNGYLCVLGGSTFRFMQIMCFGPWLSKTRSLHAKFLETKPTKEDLRLIADLLEKGHVVPYIDKRFTLDQIPQAITYIENRKVTGKVAILL